MLSYAYSRLCAGTRQPKGVSSTCPNPICQQRTAARVQGMRALCNCYVELCFYSRLCAGTRQQRANALTDTEACVKLPIQLSAHSSE